MDSCTEVCRYIFSFNNLICLSFFYHYYYYCVCVKNK